MGGSAKKAERYRQYPSVQPRETALCSFLVEDTFYDPRRPTLHSNPYISRGRNAFDRAPRYYCTTILSHRRGGRRYAHHYGRRSPPSSPWQSHRGNLDTRHQAHGWHGRSQSGPEWTSFGKGEAWTAHADSERLDIRCLLLLMLYRVSNPSGIPLPAARCAQTDRSQNQHHSVHRRASVLDQPRAILLVYGVDKAIFWSLGHHHDALVEPDFDTDQWRCVSRRPDQAEARWAGGISVS